MSTQILEKGEIELTACSSSCRACNRRGVVFQITGNTGYVTMCVDCLEVLSDEALRHVEASQ